ncbi:60S acidic ribosomal protein P0 [Nosema bombycis CQ1]|uniref:Large ribosomal subunit protein uL10 n=2 Tax=Nosema bombycis TaxID=27978 RepID=R0MH72_NOSB1|nr:60S ribosomal protein P0 [Nosema bombycis]EOB12143.1 60S acidic ribosomal protein P0 [Nosema bombycis CQ1]|eukprot:EOB12143.1 60S acidic ribosomal protein P0 [Nosema bombycis CQ1]
MSVKEMNKRKLNTYEKAKECFTTYSKFAIVSMENVISSQLKNLKKSWGSDAVFLTGKNSSIRRALQDLNKEDLIDKIKGNISIVFFSKDIKEVKKKIDDNERESVAKIGDISQRDVWIKGHITSMTSDKTGYFQTLGIPTKITKGKIEIMQDFKVLSPGDKVGPSQVNLLALINIKPFRYKMNILNIYEEGEFYDPSLIDITEEEIQEVYSKVIRSIASVSLGLKITTEASVPYEIQGCFKDILKVSYGTGFMMNDSPYFLIK